MVARPRCVVSDIIAFTMSTLPGRYRNVIPPLMSSNQISTGIMLLQKRWKHSKRQLKRLFLQNPGRLGVEAKRLAAAGKPSPAIGDIPQRKYPPIFSPSFLSNGWSSPPPPNSLDQQLQTYPFAITRTGNKPNHAPGFLPIYSKPRSDGTLVVTRIRKVSGDHAAFVQELRAVLQIPQPPSPRPWPPSTANDPPPVPTTSQWNDPIRMRTGGTIDVKGNHVRAVKEWLAGLGF
jgi:hypothetical protein